MHIGKNSTQTNEFATAMSAMDPSTLLSLFRSTSIFAMALGYNLVECGSIRSQNAVHTLFKFMLFTAISSLVYWSVGYAFAFGSPANGMIGHHSWFTSNPAKLIDVLFHSMLTLLVATSSSAAFAERLKLLPSCAYCFLITGFVYPTVSHWLWSDQGWLRRLGAIDNCGSAVVFLVSGTAGLVGTWFLGPRQGRFIPRLLPLFGHNMPIQTIGHFLIFCGFLSLNCVSSSGDLSPAIGRGAYNTLIAGSASGLCFYILSQTCSFYGVRLKRRFHLSISNSIIAGMTSVASGSPFYKTWASLISGVMTVPVYMLFSKSISRLKVDDPADLSAAHLSGGIVGMVLVSGLKVWSGSSHSKSGWWVLLWNTCAVSVIVLWTASFVIIAFFALSILTNYRFSFEDEIRGLGVGGHAALYFRFGAVGVDLYHYGEPAYALRIYCASCGEQLQSRAAIGSSSLCGMDNGDEMPSEHHNHNSKTYQQQTTIITDAEGAIVPFECLTDGSSNPEYNA